MVDIHHPYQPDPSPAPVSYQHQSAGVTMPGMNPALSQANTGSPLPLYYGASGYGYPMPTGNRANVKTPAARASAAYPLPAPANPYPYTSAPAAAPSSSAPAYNGKWGGGSAAEKRSENVTKAAPAAGPGPAVNFSSAGKPGVMKSTGAVQSGGKTAASPVGTAPPSAYPYPYSQPAAMPAQPSPCGCNEPVYPQTYSAAASFPAGAAYPQPAYYSSMSRQQGIPVYMGNQPPIPSSGQRWDNYPAESLQPLQPDFPIDDTNEE
ncbi:hypothetical protein QS257_08200 [Terrilactibacillus sp. S3-3]|nr:hypothetical protein QS257_08200 [Terrilactibacillus sp. S3-3]